MPLPSEPGAQLVIAVPPASGGMQVPLVGGGAGAAVEEAATRQKGLEITVKLDNGEVVSVVQAADREYLVGDDVKVLRNPDGTARVIQ